MMKFSGFRPLVASVSVLALATPSMAQNRSDSQPVELDDAGETETQTASDAIVVTGTRIRGARVIGEAVSVDREAIIEAGQVDLGEAIRSLPQNFSGGQNPGVGFGAGLTNDNVNSASSPNLRGLGADATLTLLNGHRLPYNSAFQGVDISAIPLAAVDRIEVVPDGASALYGSDAVGGVVNVILRRDLEGIVASGQIGSSTAGGYFRQQADIVAGTTWESGSALVAYDFANNSEINASQRDYAGSLGSNATLFPETQRHAVTLALTHEVSPGLRANVDGVHSHRRSSDSTITDVLSITRDPTLEGYAIAPSLEIEIGGGWLGQVSGVYGRDTSRFRTTNTIPGTAPTTTTGRFLNELVSLEAGIEGPLIALPGGDARLATGAGIRNNRLDFERRDPTLNTGFDVTRRARFAYAELYLPLISSRNRKPGLERLTLSAAIRHEDYADLDEQTTPRVGVSFSPVTDLSLRATWSRSFKAPTLFQQFVSYDTVLLPASIFGAGSGADTILLAVGGNPEVGPERARSLTFGFELQPSGLPGVTISATWYDISYTDRVTEPIAGSIATAFAVPGFESLIDFMPEAGALDSLIAGTEFGLRNFAGAPYDPANVAALVDNRSTNVADWSVEGVDARIVWEREFENDRSLGVDVTASWLESSQRIVEGLPDTQLAGTIFNPPQFRARGSVRGRIDRLRVSGSLNYIGALIDRRFAEENRLSAQATVDLGLIYSVIPGEGRDPDLEISLTAQNIFNVEPDVIGQTFPTDTPYDSTNFSPVGRFVALGVRTRF